MKEEDETYLETVIDELRADDGQMFHRLLKKLRDESHPDAIALLEILITHPRMRDLVPH